MKHGVADGGGVRCHTTLSTTTQLKKIVMTSAGRGDPCRGRQPGDNADADAAPASLRFTCTCTAVRFGYATLSSVFGRCAGSPRDLAVSSLRRDAVARCDHACSG